ncbi:hypothetical protein ACU686_44720 [Yinghuangia aomiensis]
MSTSILTKIQTLAAAAHVSAVEAATQAGVTAAVQHRAQVLRHAKAFAAEKLGELAAAPLVWEYVEDVDDDTHAADAWLDEYLALRVVYDYTAEKASARPAAPVPGVHRRPRGRRRRPPRPRPAPGSRRRRAVADGRRCRVMARSSAQSWNKGMVGKPPRDRHQAGDAGSATRRDAGTPNAPSTRPTCWCTAGSSLT